jgi:DNA-binding NtrC family response regulator
MPQISALLLPDLTGPLRELKAALERQSVRTHVVGSCREAWRLLKGPSPPLLIFTESRLPDGTWSDLVRLAAQAPTPVSVIVVSRLVDVPFYLDALECGAFDFIVPPYQPAELAHIVHCGVDNTLALRSALARAGLKDAARLATPPAVRV